jgi:hypothetical protein
MRAMLSIEALSLTDARSRLTIELLESAIDVAQRPSRKVPGSSPTVDRRRRARVYERFPVMRA